MSEFPGVGKKVGEFVVKEGEGVLFDPAQKNSVLLAAHLVRTVYQIEGPTDIQYGPIGGSQKNPGGD